MKRQAALWVLWLIQRCVLMPCGQLRLRGARDRCSLAAVLVDVCGGGGEVVRACLRIRGVADRGLGPLPVPGQLAMRPWTWHHWLWVRAKCAASEARAI